MNADFPVIDVGAWSTGDATTRRAVAARVDHALRTSGFMLVTGHGIDPALSEQLRSSVREFFHQPDTAKQPYRSLPGTAGWNPAGVEANAYASGAESPPDIKESITFGPVGADAVIIAGDGLNPCTNVYPPQAPDIEHLVTDYLEACRTLADRLLELCADAIGAAPDQFTRDCDDAPYTLLTTWYPPRRIVGEALPGQFRIGPHTDFGTITLLDRQPGVSGLQVQTADGGWVDAPYVPGSLTINIGDLMARWTGDRWTSNMHRSLSPAASAPDEELISLVFFFEANVDAVIEPLPEPFGGGNAHAPVVALDYLRAKMAAITVTD